jgi:hypothetical protein
MTTPQQKLSCAGVAAGLKDLHGNLAGVAKRFGVSRQAVWLFIQRHASLQEVQREAKETMKDFGESALYGAVLRGEPWAVKWYLSTQARDRGYADWEPGSAVPNLLGAFAQLAQAPVLAAPDPADEVKLRITRVLDQADAAGGPAPAG